MSALHQSPYAHTDAYWRGVLGHTIAAAVHELPENPKGVRKNLQAALRAYLNSTVIAPEVRDTLAKEMHR